MGRRTIPYRSVVSMQLGVLTGSPIRSERSWCNHRRDYSWIELPLKFRHRTANAANPSVLAAKVRPISVLLALSSLAKVGSRWASTRELELKDPRRLVDRKERSQTAESP